MTAPASLRLRELDPLWVRVRVCLETRGPGYRGRVPIPELSSSAKLALKTLLGRPLGKTVDLGALEAGLPALALAGISHSRFQILATTYPARWRGGVPIAPNARRSVTPLGASHASGRSDGRKNGSTR